MGKTRRRKKGGEIIASGKSAKVIYPAIPCKDGRDMTNYVSRVINDDRMISFLAYLNKKLMQKLKEIDPEQKYFLYPDHCEPGELLESNKEDGVTETSKIRSEFILKGKQSLKKFNKDLLSAKQKTHILNGFELLNKNKILHGDIQRGNIIIGPDDLPRFIDFDRAVVDAPENILKLEKRFLKGFLLNSKLSEKTKKLRQEIFEFVTKIKYATI